MSILIRGGGYGRIVGGYFVFSYRSSVERFSKNCSSYLLGSNSARNFFVIGPARFREALSRATKVGIAGVEIQLREEVQEVVESKGGDLSAYFRDLLLRRMNRVRDMLHGVRILWIDDCPFNNFNEIDILRKLGFIVDLAENDEIAQIQLSRFIYDIVITDMNRGSDPDAGKKFLPNIRNSISSPPVIFYVGQICDVPKGAFGLTVRPDELFHLILDALERRRG